MGSLPAAERQGSQLRAHRTVQGNSTERWHPTGRYPPNDKRWTPVAYRASGPGGAADLLPCTWGDLRSRFKSLQDLDEDESRWTGRPKLPLFSRGGPQSRITVLWVGLAGSRSSPALSSGQSALKSRYGNAKYLSSSLLTPRLSLSQEPTNSSRLPLTEVPTVARGSHRSSGLSLSQARSLSEAPTAAQGSHCPRLPPQVEAPTVPGYHCTRLPPQLEALAVPGFYRSSRLPLSEDPSAARGSHCPRLPPQLQALGVPGFHRSSRLPLSEAPTAAPGSHRTALYLVLLSAIMAHYGETSEAFYYDDPKEYFEHDLVYALDSGVQHTVNKALGQAIWPIKQHLMGFSECQGWIPPSLPLTKEDSLPHQKPSDSKVSGARP
ncbi:hypothetical protein NDU88_001459 [Pleurodeles waltl]|uniref:Uncharacterized protein n=1 Tax=Pleurodeles waltl TaxID=8319 RepID=A0AAV7P477_PLEWA|nr:hypothetical protein NDU88_001459 [Pleurodeles waltl]